MDALLTFPGVGRKIANLLLGDIYRLPAIVADTHCIRISGRLGLIPAGCKDATKVERALVPIIAPEEQSDFCHRIVWFGREVCTARAPKCQGCPLKDLCTGAQK
jgi:endonuclease-3